MISYQLLWSMYTMAAVFFLSKILFSLVLIPIVALAVLLPFIAPWWFTLIICLLFRYFVICIDITFSRIFESGDNMWIGLKFIISSKFLFLAIGIILLILKMEGNSPVLKHRLISFRMAGSIIVLMLFYEFHWYTIFVNWFWVIEFWYCCS